MYILRCFLVFLCVCLISNHVKADEKDDFKLSFPLACELHKNCWLLYYVDVNRTPDYVEDFSCGKRSYDQHKGTDFAIKDKAAMQAGIDVLAAAPGTVLRLRDGMDDTFKDNAALDEVRKSGKECGNGLIIDHGDGWRTQYCHLRKGSIIVKSGEEVARGQAVGKVGISGLAEHPHLHLTLYKDKKLMDPFMGREVSEGCGIDYYDSLALWDETMPARDARVGYFDSGFASTMPKFSNIPKGDKGVPLKIGAKALIFWLAMFDVRQGDYIKMHVEDEHGIEIVSRVISQKKDKIRQYYAAGLKKPEGVPAGVYTAKVALTRVLRTGETQTFHHQKTITLGQQE